MALAATTIWEWRATATAGNLNAGGFNTASNSFTDLAATSANTASPVITTATYTFLDPQDVGGYLYIASGTSWTPGFYPILSVSGGAATINAAVGAAAQLDAISGRYLPNTVAGCGTTGTLSNGTGGVSFIHQDAAEIASTDGACTTPSTTFTSATGGFRRDMVGNLLHITAATGAGAVIGCFEIITVTDANTLVLDRTPAPTNNTSASTFKIGGALSMATSGTHSDDTMLEMVLAGNRVMFKNGSFSTTATVSVASSGTLAAPVRWTGYNSVWGDINDESNRPVIAVGANAFLVPLGSIISNISFTATSANGIGANGIANFENCRFFNNSTTTTRNACTGAASLHLIRCECISYRGYGFNVGSSSVVLSGCTFRESDRGISLSGVGNIHIIVRGSAIVNCRSFGIAVTGAITGSVHVYDCTLAGNVTPTGVGLDFATGVTVIRSMGNIFYGWATGINCADSSINVASNYDTFSNNTTDVTNFQRGRTDIAVAPAFTSYAEINFTNGTTSGSVLTSSGADFSTVTDGTDCLYLVSGTGITTGFYGISSHTATTLTLDLAPGTDATADKVGRIMTGHNLVPTGAI